MRTEGKEAVRSGGDERKLKVRRVGEEHAADGGVVVEEGHGADVRVKAAEQKSCVQPTLQTVPMVQGAGQHMYGAGHHAGLDQDVMHFIPSYKSTMEDRNWAENGVVASVLGGDSTLTLQQRIEDAGFHIVVVTPMGVSCLFTLHRWR